MRLAAESGGRSSGKQETGPNKITGRAEINPGRENRGDTP